MSRPSARRSVESALSGLLVLGSLVLLCATGVLTAGLSMEVQTPSDFVTALRDPSVRTITVTASLRLTADLFASGTIAINRLVNVTGAPALAPVDHPSSTGTTGGSSNSNSTNTEAVPASFVSSSSLADLGIPQTAVRVSLDFAGLTSKLLLGKQGLVQFTSLEMRSHLSFLGFEIPIFYATEGQPQVVFTNVVHRRSSGLPLNIFQQHVLSYPIPPGSSVKASAGLSAGAECYGVLAYADGSSSGVSTPSNLSAAQGLCPSQILNIGKMATRLPVTNGPGGGYDVVNTESYYWCMAYASMDCLAVSGAEQCVRQASDSLSTPAPTTSTTDKSSGDSKGVLLPAIVTGVLVTVVLVGVTWYITSKRKSQAQQRASAAGAVPATLAGIENITKWPRGNYGGGAPPPANKGMAGDFGGGGPHAGGNVVELVVAKGIAPEKTRMALEQIARVRQEVATHVVSGGEQDMTDLRIVELIGAGTFGRVYKGIWAGAPVAVKVISMPGHQYGTPQWSCLLSEAAIATSLAHPNVLHTYSVVLLECCAKDTPTSGSGNNHRPPLQLSAPETPASAVTPVAVGAAAAPAAPLPALGGAGGNGGGAARAALAMQGLGFGSGVLGNSDGTDAAGPTADRQQTDLGMTAAGAMGSAGHAAHGSISVRLIAEGGASPSPAAGASPASLVDTLDDQPQHLATVTVLPHGVVPPPVPEEAALPSADAGPGADAVVVASPPPVHVLPPQQTPTSAALAAAAAAAAAAGTQVQLSALHTGLPAEMHALSPDVFFQLRMVSEYCDAGSLRTALGERIFFNADGSVNFPLVLDVALQVARAMAYLHAANIIHADLKPANVLLQRSAHRMSGSGINGGPVSVDGNAGIPVVGGAGWAMSVFGGGAAPGLGVGSTPGSAMTSTSMDGIVQNSGAGLSPLARSMQGMRLNAKVCDFGLSLRLDAQSSHASRQFLGTPTHMAPEVLLRGHVSRSADIYAFGILCWELYTSKAPYPDLAPGMLAYAVGSRGDRPVFPPEAPAVFRALARACWAHDPAARPPFTKIIALLDTMVAPKPASGMMTISGAAAGAGAGAAAAQQDVVADPAIAAATAESAAASLAAAADAPVMLVGDEGATEHAADGIAAAGRVVERVV